MFLLPLLVPGGVFATRTVSIAIGDLKTAQAAPPTSDDKHGFGNADLPLDWRPCHYLVAVASFTANAAMAKRTTLIIGCAI